MCGEPKNRYLAPLPVVLEVGHQVELLNSIIYYLYKVNSHQAMKACKYQMANRISRIRSLKAGKRVYLLRQSDLATERWGIGKLAERLAVQERDEELLAAIFSGIRRRYKQ